MSSDRHKLDFAAVSAASASRTRSGTSFEYYSKCGGSEERVLPGYSTPIGFSIFNQRPGREVKPRIIELREENLEEMGSDACLSFSIPLANTGADAGGGLEPPMLLSYTREVGPDCLELLVPSLPFLYRYLLNSDFTLRFELNLPCGPISIEGVPTYDKPLAESDTDIGYIVTGGEIEIKGIAPQYMRHEKDSTEMERLIGVRIKKMSDGDRKLYDEYLQSLADECPMLVGQVIILPDDEECAGAATEPSRAGWIRAA